MPSRRNRRRILAGAVLLLLALIIVPPYVRVNRYREEMAGSLSRALGREVRLGEITLKLVPQPGFEVTNLVIMDDPAFSAEPMVQAETVTAALRMTSLFRRRLEIARLSLQYTSLNLVRNAEGRWNLEGLLARAAQTPSAPTAAIPDERPRFPYIEAEDARVNFKFGSEKKPYALSQADFALWLQADDEWNMRLKAVPVRTDLPLSDSATLRVTGSFRRAERVRDMALNFRAEIEDAQMGQIARFFYGRDRGLRGTVDLGVNLAGTASDLAVSSDVTMVDFRRYDVASASSRIQARCTARFDGVAEHLHAVECAVPAGGEGDLYVRGSIRRLMSEPEFDLGIAVRRLPVSAALATARRLKLDLPEDLTGDGELTAAFVLKSSSLQGKMVTFLVGGGEARNLVLRSAVLGQPLAAGTLRFAMTPPASNDTRQRLVISPFAISLGAPTPARVQAEFSGSQYSVRVTGDAELDRLLRIARASGLRPTELAASGSVFLDLNLSGGWAGFAPPAITGRAQLRSATAEFPGLATRVEIAGANVVLDPLKVRIENMRAALERTAISGTGWAELPRNCGSPESCVVRFDLAMSPLSIDDINRLTNPKLQSRPWYRVMGGSTRKSVLTSLRAQGMLSSPRVTIKQVSATRVVAGLRLEAGKLTLDSLRSEVFGGQHTGKLNTDFTSDPPQYSASGSLARANMAQLTAALGDAWASGPADFDYTLAMAGWDAASLMAGADGAVEFTWRDGGFRNLVLRPGTGPVRVRDFHGRLQVKDGRLFLSQSKLSAPGGIYEVSGTATFDRQIDLTFNDGGASAYAVTGTMAQPKVAPVPRTEAALR